MPYTQREAPATQEIETGDHFRQHQRIMFGHEADAGGQPNTVGARGDIAQRDERVHPVDRAWCGEGPVVRVRILGIAVAVEQHDVLRGP